LRNGKKVILLFFLIVSLTFCACGRKNDLSTVQSLAELHDQSFTIGTPTVDNVHNELNALFPNAELLAYDDILVGLSALKSGKIDTFVSGRFFIERDIAETGITDIRILDEPVKTYYVGLGLNEKTPVENYTGKVNAALREMKENGTLADMQKRWFLDGTEDMPEIRVPEDPEYTLRVVTYGASKPYSYIRDNTLTGFDVELARRVAAAIDCGISFEMADYSSMLMGLSLGKYDMISANLYISQDRAENVCFSDPYSQNDICLCVYSPGGTHSTAVRNPNDPGATDSSGNSGVRNSLSTVRSGLSTTFVDESRWKMVLSGLGTTCVITVFGFLLANIFGGLFCALAMSKSKFCRGIFDVCFRIMQGTPIVVLLMILFYIIFGRSSLSGTFVAILGFGLSSGASLAQQFQGAITSVSRGQSEASLALGFSGWQTFFGIVFPQALRRLLPGYFSELIGLMKGTSVVGYVAVTDLTKVSDIIRSATYDAFFPLISVALIYFIIAMVLLTVLKAILKKLEPKRVTTQEVNK